jgi:hypothetical protein
VYRSGLLDSVYRFSVNLKGGPAMPPQDFMKWRQKMLIGVSALAHRTIRPYETDQLGQQPLGIQA